MPISLEKGLIVEGYEEEIQVVVVSESLAAFARETNPALSEEKRIRKGETVLLIDCGSSTFDVTLVTEDQKYGKWRVQLSVWRKSY
ncbi:MAG: hypothetical protein V8S12_00195 [Lachnospiraceae bacterium]